MSCSCHTTSTPTTTANKAEMVPVDLSQPNGSASAANGANGAEVVNGCVPNKNGVLKRQGATHNGPHRPTTNTTAHQTNPYAPRYADFLSNVSNFNIIESTLRGTPLELSYSQRKSQFRLIQYAFFFFTFSVFASQTRKCKHAHT